MASLQWLFVKQSLFVFGVTVSIGSLGGDLLGAFIKRRLKLPPGYPLPLLDQLDFVLGGLALTSFFYRIEVYTLFLILLVTPIIHIAANALAYLWKLKDVFW
jgi:CDP-2,3-bis-(O-geranylgeranyl)-sn-glycerol synthase